MNHAKWHKYSSFALLISALVCIYSGHKLTGVRQKAEQQGSQKGK